MLFANNSSSLRITAAIKRESFEYADTGEEMELIDFCNDFVTSFWLCLVSKGSTCRFNRRYALAEKDQKEKQ